MNDKNTVLLNENTDSKYIRCILCENEALQEQNSHYFKCPIHGILKPIKFTVQPPAGKVTGGVVYLPDRK